MQGAKTSSAPRLIAAVYSGDPSRAEAAYRKLRGAKLGPVAWMKPDGSIVGDPGQPILRLEGEALVAVRVKPPFVQAAIDILQSAGAPTIFFLPTKVDERPEPGLPCEPVQTRLRESETGLEEAQHELLQALQLEHALSPSAEWLLDNFHLAIMQIAEMRRDAPKGSGKRISPGEIDGYQYACGLTRKIIQMTDHSVQGSTIQDILTESQKTRPLTIAQLWSFPLLLRLTLVEELAVFATRVSQNQLIREAAYFWANRLIVSARRDNETLDSSLAAMEESALSPNPYFITCLAEQLQDEEGALARIQHWLERLPTSSLDGMVRSEHNREAAECVSISNAFGSLRTLARVDFTAVFEATSLTEAELRVDPTGVYQRSDFATRNRCRQVVERLGRESGKDEPEIARRAVVLASRPGEVQAGHVAYYLIGDGIAELEQEVGARVPPGLRLRRGLRRHGTGFVVGGTFWLTCSFLLLALSAAWSMGVHQTAMLIALGALAMFPLSELAVQIINALIISILPPCMLPKLRFDEGIPADEATLVIVPMMLVNREVVEHEVEKLEVRFLANRDRNLSFGLFSDFTDAPAATMAGDTKLVQYARDGIESLNLRYPGSRFVLFHRPRVWSESERLWIGKERKRGKLEELNAFLNGDGSPDILVTGTLDLPIRYVITLDADTQLPPGAGCRLVETIAHPLNRAVLDPVTRTRIGGYTIIQPRVSITLPGATATRFTRIFADTSGTDPYCQTVSDAQQDLFGHAMYHGKAIYDVRSFHTSLHQRFPPETLLSHDLIEGAHVGVGLATDTELFETMPLDYGSYCKRQHRWIRGDWQIAPWIWFRVPTSDGEVGPNPLSLINRWRILDNLRRSLVPIATLLLLLSGWLISVAPGVWSLVLALAVVIPVMAPLLDRLARRLQGTIRGWQGAADELIRAFFTVVFLPHQAWLSADAIARALFRMRFSRKHLLEWQTAEGAKREARVHLSLTMRQLVGVSSFSALLLVLLIARGGLLVPTAPFVALWIASPWLMRWMGRAGRSAQRNRLDRDSTVYLRRMARRTWRYFDDLVGPENNWLPPDNSQLALNVEVAQRTSPTNIGLWLTSLLAARDFGFLTTDDLCRRCTETMATLQRMEKYEGHFLNWYDTRTLAPLAPRYVSTVDSGNLLASLWVLERGCEELLRAPILGLPGLRGLSDTVALLREVCGDDPSATGPLHTLRRILRGKVEGHALISRLRLAVGPAEELRDLRWVLTSGDERSYWALRLHSQIESWIAAVDRYLPWMEILVRPTDAFLQTIGEEVVTLRRRALQTIPSLLTMAEGAAGPVAAILQWRGSADLRPGVATWLEQLYQAHRLALANAAETVRQLRSISESAYRISDAINMRFLYDEPRRLFGVGYAVGDQLVFKSHYDLLASECRLASLVAIAKGDVPVSHWFALGRPRVTAGKHHTLLSWSGTMFEYLMPLLFTRTFANSLLDQACFDAVDRQVEYGNDQGVPWGISECAYSALDANQTYQYRAFGVPQLALQRDAKAAVVVAPYATMLALALEAPAAVENLKRLEELGAVGPMGFYEAIDFMRSAKRGGEPGVTIYAYMAHHQGMTLLALNNALHRGATTKRFHEDRRVRAFESLLFERIPITPSLLDPAKSPAASVRVAPVEEGSIRNWDDQTGFPRVHLQGNGSYSLMITNAGTGYSRWNGFDISRWRADSTIDPWGTYVYIRDVRTDTVWSTTPKPMGGGLGTSAVRFSADRAEFNRRVLGIDSNLHVTVSPEDNVELRRITLINRSLRSREVELTSYSELALAPHAVDKAHPVFAKMFIQTECPEEGLLLAWRRQRSPDEPRIWVAHLLVGAPAGIQYETDRGKFLGRGHDTGDPAFLRRDLTGTTGVVLDPIFSLRCRVTLEPREQVELSFITLAAGSREEVMALVAKYRRPESIARALEVSWTKGQLEFRHLGIGPVTAQRFQELAGYLIYPGAALRAASDRLLKNRLGQSSLWVHGISGDFPMLTVAAGDTRGVALVRELLIAHSYWRARGFQSDLIILNQEPPGYDRPFGHALERQIAAHSGLTGTDQPGGVFLRDWHALPEEHRTLILAVSNVVLSDHRGSLQQQLLRAGEAPLTPLPPPSATFPERSTQPLPSMKLEYFNGLGGFTRGGGEYVIQLGADGSTPVPWINVMAHASFGTVASESGLGATWRGNSQSHRLTPWNNDPLTDPPSEVVYLRDEESEDYWTPTPRPTPIGEAYRVRHGQGYTVYEHNSHEIGQTLTVFVPIAADGAGEPVKILHLRLRNDSARHRRLSATYLAEWVLGSQREDQQRHVQTAWDVESGALLATQTWTDSGGIAFASSSPRATSWSGDRAQFIGRTRSYGRPAALSAESLDNRTGVALDPCAALQCSVDLPAGQSTDVIFLLGETNTTEDARRLVQRYRAVAQVSSALETVRGFWDRILGTIQVRTPSARTDLLLNRWLLYQSLSCRFWGRTALYQSGGAFGFRDQLQDSLALVYAAPQLTRAHILLAASRQFAEGDVQHWWHPDSGNGVRTFCSDDLLWLPYAVSRYADITGDFEILSEQVLFLDAPVLTPGEHDRLFIPGQTEKPASLWEHCRRAIDHAWRLGQHDLPLIGTGDWNDGMDRVGVEGRGESAWLAWFLCSVMQDFAQLTETLQHDPDSVQKWRSRAKTLAAAMEHNAWDGEWYVRAFFDNGAALGKRGDPEASIDSLPQSWAVISGAAEPARARQALASADRLLVDEKHGLVRLFTPPFNHSHPHPGYIMGYPPGVRENGGQYTHGSLWLAMAWARSGDGRAAVRLLEMMNPVEKTRTPDDVMQYRGEPYVVAADVFSTATLAGRCGWTWYTGSAAWMYRIWLEEVLGFRLRGSVLTIVPVIPDEWPEFQISYVYGSTTYAIIVLNHATEYDVEVDGHIQRGMKEIQLVDDGAPHRIVVRIVPSPARRPAAAPLAQIAG